jgi:uncharacterized membrane protein
VIARAQDTAAPVRSPDGPGGSLALYSAAVAGLGALLLSGRFVYVWAPIPQWVPGRGALAAVWGAAMLLFAIGLWRRRGAARSSAGLTFLFLSWLLLVQVPRLLGAPGREVLWAGASQITTVVAGGWILFALLAAPTPGRGRWLRGSGAVRMARALYALALPLFGFHHFVDAAGAAEAVPAWLPFRLGWAYLTGAAHVAAAVGILFSIAPRLAATLEAIMIASFVLLVHVPGVLGAPLDRLQWTMLVVACAIGAAGWVVARSYAGTATPPATADGDQTARRDPVAAQNAGKRGRA